MTTRDEARLLVQSPRRLFFYWRFARDPRPALVAALGDAAAKLRLSVRLVEPEGDWEGEPAAVSEGGDAGFWFDALPGRAYRAEVGFHAEGLPFVRLLSSGAVETPVAAVSPEGDAAAQFRIGEREYARVLEGSGFRHDARGPSPDALGPRATSSDSHASRASSSPAAPASRGRPSSDASLPSSSSRATSPARGGEVF